MTGTLGSLESLSGVPLHLSLDNTGVGLVACDTEGRLTLMSPMLQELFAMAYEPVPEECLVDTFHLFRSDGTTRLPVAEVPLVRARHGEFVKDAVVTTRQPDGHLVHLRCNAVPLRDGDRPAGAIAIAQDVTAEVEAAQRAEALRARLVETINHEFRTPLAALLGHVELVRGRDDVDPELAGCLDAIERAGWRLRDLVCEVAELVRAEDGDQPVDRRTPHPG